MKKFTATLLAMVLLLSLAACGTPNGDNAQDTTTTTTTTAGENTTTATTTVGTDSGDTTATTVTTTTTTTAAATTTYVPSGATVPIGTKPTTTTTTKKPTTTTNAQVEEPTGTTTVTKPTTTTTTTVKPTQPSVDGPYIVLPEVGSDIDVTKKKNRIRVSAVAAWRNDNGTIGVSLTFKNYSANWITEETDYVEYTCYDKNGNVVQKATRIAIGVIDTKKHPVKEFVFDVPATTAEVRITKSKIVYWTEWS